MKYKIILLLIVIAAVILSSDITAAKALEKIEVVYKLDEYDIEAYKVIYIENGSSPDAVKIPTREGYIFRGWKQNGILHEGAIPTLTDNTVLIAQWEAIEYLVYCYTHDGSKIDTFRATVNSQITNIPLPEAPEGKIFKGWYSYSMDKLLDHSTVIEGSMAIYAVFEDKPTAIATIWQSFGLWQTAAVWKVLIIIALLATVITITVITIKLIRKYEPIKRSILWIIKQVKRLSRYIKEKTSDKGKETST